MTKYLSNEEVDKEIREILDDISRNAKSDLVWGRITKEHLLRDKLTVFIHHIRQQDKEALIEDITEWLRNHHEFLNEGFFVGLGPLEDFLHLLLNKKDSCKSKVEDPWDK